MYALTNEDAKYLNRVANAERSELETAITDYGQETHFIGVMEGMIFLGVDIIGVVLAYKIAKKAGDGFCRFSEDALSEFFEMNK